MTAMTSIIVSPKLDLTTTFDHQNFGYFPNDLITFMKLRNDYRFYRIDEKQEMLIEIWGFAESDIGANVICLPSEVAMLH